jgi:hypothetical protein
MVLKLHNKHTI